MYISRYVTKINTGSCPNTEIKTFGQGQDHLTTAQNTGRNICCSHMHLIFGIKIPSGQVVSHTYSFDQDLGHTHVPQTGANTHPEYNVVKSGY